MNIRICIVSENIAEWYQFTAHLRCTILFWLYAKQKLNLQLIYLHHLLLSKDTFNKIYDTLGLVWTLRFTIYTEASVHGMLFS